MKYILKLIVSALLVLNSASLYAIDADLMIGTGAKSRAMGGVGIAKGFGADSGFANPALIHISKGFGAESSFANPHLANEHMEFTINVTGLTQEVDLKSYVNDEIVEDFSSDLNILPELGFVYIIDDFAMGIQIMSVDNSNAHSVSNENNLCKIETDSQAYKIVIPLAYKIRSRFTLGIAPVFQYEKEKTSIINIDYVNDDYVSSSSSSNENGFGYELGLTYKTPLLFLNHLDVTLGAAYKSEVETSSNIILMQAEYGFGASFNYHAGTLAFDYRNRDNYQEVYAIGYEYLANVWAIRVGYNHTKSPDNFVNLASFPRTTENYYTFGFGFDITNSLTLDTALMYAQDRTKVYSLTSENCDANIVQATHSQSSLTIGLTSRF